jgi:hypothetical protein
MRRLGRDPMTNNASQEECAFRDVILRVVRVQAEMVVDDGHLTLKLGTEARSRQISTN